MLKKDADLIDVLSKDLKNPSPSYRWTERYWLYWSLWVGLMGLLTLVAAWVRSDLAYLPDDLSRLGFWAQVGLWFVAAVLCGMVTATSSVPTQSVQRLKKFSMFFIAALSGSILLQNYFMAMNGSMAHELHNDMIGCGVFILVTGLASGAGMFLLIRKAAPTNLAQTGAWSAASMGCLSMAFMHLVCRQETSAHLLLMHFLPFAALSALSAYTYRQALRW